MILYLERNFSEGVDLLTFFPRENSISTPSHLWFSVISASLKLKNSVLFTSNEIPQINQVDQTKRWVAGDDWCWLHPRSLSTISTQFSNNPLDFQEFLQFLRTSK